MELVARTGRTEGAYAAEKRGTVAKVRRPCGAEGLWVDGGRPNDDAMVVQRHGAHRPCPVGKDRRPPTEDSLDGQLWLW